MTMNINFPKEEVQELPERFEINIPDPLTYINVLLYKPKKYGGYSQEYKKIYLTANIWYGSETSTRKSRTSKSKRIKASTNDSIIRSEAKSKGVWQLHAPSLNVPRYWDTPIKVTVEYTSKRATFDLNNKCYFWEKLFTDHLVKLGKLKDDNVSIIKEVHYKYIKGETNLRFIIEKL